MMTIQPVDHERQVRPSVPNQDKPLSERNEP
jgi:hypothetical protein